MAATTASDYFQTSASLVDRLSVSEDGHHLRVVTSASLKVGDIIGALLISEGFGWELQVAGPCLLGSEDVFRGNEFIWMQVLHSGGGGKSIVASRACSLPASVNPDMGFPESGVVVFADTRHALVPHQWFCDNLVETGVVTIGRKRSAEAMGGGSSESGGPGASGTGSGESPAAVPANALDPASAAAVDLDGNPHKPPPQGAMGEKVESSQFLLRLFDIPRRKAYLTREYVLRGDELLDDAFTAMETTGAAPGLQALQNIRKLPFLAGGAGKGSLLYDFMHAK
jgi:hypothetical protein